MDATQQTFAIIFGNVPSNYTVKDIILNHLNSKKNSKQKNDISSNKLMRWRRAIRIININKDKQEAHIIFSSIFYWCKYCRLVIGNEKQLKVAIYPAFFESIQHPINIEFISSFQKNKTSDHELIKLFNLPPNVISYCFICDDILYITLKIENDKELLIKISSCNISKVLAMNNNDNNNNNKKYMHSQLILKLTESCQIFEYFHKSTLWICGDCNTVNKVNHDGNSINSMQCIVCGEAMNANNPFHHHQINELFGHWNMGQPNLDVAKFRFIDQSRFYRQISSFLAHEQFAVLSPLMNVLDDNKRDIASSIMFTNTLKMEFKNNEQQMMEYLDKYMTKMDKEIIRNHIECKATNFDKFRATINSIFVWLSDKAHDFIFPILSKLLDFRNPACFSDEMEEFVAKIEELQELGSTSWLIIEAIMSCNIVNAAELEGTVETLEQHYEDKGIVDIDDETAKPPLIWNLQISPFCIKIKEADAEFLNGREEWQRLQTVSTQNYVVSFCMKSKEGAFNEFNNIKPMMQYKPYIFIDDKKNNEIMHCLEGFDADYIQYGATICNRPLNDEKLIDHFKEAPIKNDSNYDNDDKDNDDSYCIDNSNVYHHHHKKMKISYDSNNDNKGIIYNDNNKYNDNIPDLMDISRSNNNNIRIKSVKNEEIDNIISSTQAVITQNVNIKTKETSNSNNKAMIQITSSMNTSKHEEINDIIPSTQTVTTNIEYNQEIEDIEEKQENTSSISPIPPPRNQIIGRKRKRNQIIDSSPESSPSPSPAILLPISYMKSDIKTPSKSIKPHIPSKSNIKTNVNLVIKGDVGWSFGVPIYNKFYWDCTDFGDFPLQEFGELCVDMICKSDIRIEGDLRNGRNRTKTDKDGADAQFLKGVPDATYRDLFDDCFTMKEREKMDIYLNDYLSERRKIQRDGRNLVIYRRGWRDFKTRKMLRYGIKEDMKYRLLLLMRLYQKDVTEGVLDRQNIAPPWHVNDDLIIDELNDKMNVMTIDLTNIHHHDNDDNDDDVDVDMKEDNVIKNEKKVRIKKEFGFDGEYDSEWE